MHERVRQLAVRGHADGLRHFSYKPLADLLSQLHTAPRRVGLGRSRETSLPVVPRRLTPSVTRLGGTEDEVAVEGRGDFFPDVFDDVEARELPIPDASSPRREVQSPDPVVPGDGNLDGPERAVFEGM